jgi:hypothetical protein
MAYGTAMGKRIYWVLVALVTLTGIGFMIYYGIQPRPVPKIKLSKFESPAVLASSLLLRLRQEIRANPVVFLGVEPEHPEQLQVWREFLNRNREAASRFEVIVIDENLKASSLFPEASALDTKGQMDSLIEGIGKATAQGKRVAVITASIYSSQLIFGNLIHNFKEHTAKNADKNTDPNTDPNAEPLAQKTPMSLSIVDFPRTRQQEKSMIHPCIVDGVDQTGLGPFGCVIAQMSRANYRKHFEPGTRVGMVNQVGLNDYLILYTQEK